MSELITVSKEIEIQIDHVQCHDCGNDLSFKVNSDIYGDLQITVEKCDFCGDEG